MLQVLEHAKQFGQHATVRSGEHGLAFLAVILFPCTQEADIVGELFLLFVGFASHGASLRQRNDCDKPANKPPPSASTFGGSRSGTSVTSKRVTELGDTSSLASAPDAP